MGSYISVQKDQRSQITYYLISVKISAPKLKYRCHEEYYKREPDLVREEDFILKGEQELFRQSGLFLEKGTAYKVPRGRE